MATALENKQGDTNSTVVQNTKQVQDSIKNLISTTENLVLNEFPSIILQLNKIIVSQMFREGISSDAYHELNISISSVVLINGPDESPPAKRKKQEEETITESNSITKCSTFPINKKVEAVVKIIKPYVKKLAENANLVKLWISLLIPKIEDGNNFGVSIQAGILAEAQSVENDTNAYSEHISNYYITRGRLISKLYKYPFVEDYKYAVQELDERQFLNLYMIITEIRNRYYTLYDVIVKNIEKIRKPRSTNVTESFY